MEDVWKYLEVEVIGPLGGRGKTDSILAQEQDVLQVNTALLEKGVWVQNANLYHLGLLGRKDSRYLIMCFSHCNLKLIQGLILKKDHVFDSSCSSFNSFLCYNCG